MGGLKPITSHGEAPPGAVCVTPADADTTPRSAVPTVGAAGCPAPSVQLGAVHACSAVYIHFQFLCTSSLPALHDVHCITFLLPSPSLHTPWRRALVLALLSVLCVGWLNCPKKFSKAKWLRLVVRFCFLLVVVSSVLHLQWDKAPLGSADLSQKGCFPNLISKKLYPGSPLEKGSSVHKTLYWNVP